MPNPIAYLMLAIWPIVCLVMFRKMPLERALIWSILGGYLILPPLAEFNLPLVPSMDKTSIPALSAALIIFFVLGKRFKVLPEYLPAKALTLLFVLMAIPTVLTNPDPIIFEVLENSDPIRYVTGILPGLSLRDTLSVLISQVLTLLPFLLGRQFLGTALGMREILIALMVGALIYSIPSLIEIRFSPQMNVWVYGFFQHSFEQMMRGGGFRPIVFLPHGLWLAFFVVTALLAAAALYKDAPVDQRFRMMMVVGYLAVLLVLCKSLASLAYGVALTPLILFTSPKTQVRVAIIFALIAVIYPVLRNGQLIPLDAIIAKATAFNPDRAQSLEYRFDNEQWLLWRASDKPWFGWGGWGRNLIRDGETGQILSIPDGRWIIVFGTWGRTGYIAEFGLLALPIFLTGWQMRGQRINELSPYVVPLVLILSITLVDMLLNATLIPLTWLTCGAILGHLEQVRAAKPKPVLFPDGPVMTRAAPGPRSIL
ncbi:hypothetical protein [Oceaniglobus ichthyenteri]|uniref:hypothetical protein n=1 Tax=Oceaniglobus ichthyenteri TaxID=2136177 RepID=UPI000D3536EA|nr:hypothetical protein [Oceaniglobus ichthyenteri]